MAGGTQRPLALISAGAENSRGVLVKDGGLWFSFYQHLNERYRHLGGGRCGFLH